MPRVKRGVASHARHKKVLKLAKGHIHTRSTLFRRATESLLHAKYYSTVNRKQRKDDFRRLWITRINAAARPLGMSYSKLMAGLKKAGIALDRKMLAELAVSDEQAFGKLVEAAKA
jgi:large subunit ribosomal protein L20